jgi:hypothetical protein
MALEVWNGSTWAAMTDPEIWNGSSWININRGQVWNGTDWVTFYNRNSNEVYSDLDTVSKTKTSIKIGVNHTGTDRRRAVVWISGLFLTTAQTTGVFTSNMVSSNAATQLDFTGLTRNTTYDFDSYIEYLDASNNVISTGPTMPVLHTDTTLDHAITIPTTPVNTGTVTSTILSFKASSNANYTNNGVAATLYFELYNSLGVLKQTLSSALPNNDTLTERTVTFYDVDYGTSHTCKARTYYGGAINDYSAYSSNSSVVSTEPFHVPVAPTRLDEFTDEDTITMVTTGNAYSNGDAYMKWEVNARTAGSSGAWTVSFNSDSENLLTDDSTSRFVSYSFVANQTDEYRFRARVFYADLTDYAGGGITSGNGAYGPYSEIVRPKLWVRQYKPSSTTYAAASDTALFPGSSFGASSENSPHVKGNASDGSSSTFWESYPYIVTTGTATRSRTLGLFARSAGGIDPWISTYYKSGGDDFDFDDAYPNVSTTVVSLRYGINVMAYRSKTDDVFVTLDSSSRIALIAGDQVSVTDNSIATYNRSYTVISASGTSVVLNPSGTSPSTTSTGSGGTLRVFESRGESVGVLGGTSARTAVVASSYVQREDGEYGYDVPLSTAAGSISWTVGTVIKTDKTSTDTDNINVLFTPSLPEVGEYQNARLDGVAVQIGTPAATRIKIEINGTERFDSAGFGTVAEGWIYISGFSATPTYAGNSFLINCIVYPGLHAPDGKYYSEVKEIQIRYSYETLTG